MDDSTARKPTAALVNDSLLELRDEVAMLESRYDGKFEVLEKALQNLQVQASETQRENQVVMSLMLGTLRRIEKQPENTAESPASRIPSLSLDSECNLILNDSCIASALLGKLCVNFQSTKISLLGVHRVPKKSSQQVNIGPMTIPVGMLKCDNHSETSLETSSPLIGTTGEENIFSESIAMVVESELDESTRVGGWVQMEKPNPRHLQWAGTMSDSPDDDFGWGLSLGGLVQGPKSWDDHFQVEAFLKLKLGNRFTLQPGLVHVMNGTTTQFPAVTLRSSWSL